MNQKQPGRTFQKEPGLIKKTTRMRYIQIQKEPGRSANNLEEGHQEPEKSRNDLVE